MRRKVFGMITSASALDYTLEALKTFFIHTPLNPGDLFVLIDNDSSFDEDNLRAYQPWVHLVRNKQMKSFSANGNIAMRIALENEADFYFMNNDLVFSPRWLEPLTVDQPWLISPACNMQIQYTTPNLRCRLQMDLDEYLGHEQEFLAIVQRHQSTPNRGYRFFHSVPYYCMKIPYVVHREIGFFDEAYNPIGWEDTDYTVRCLLREFPIYFALDSYIIHFYGKSTWRKEEVAAEKPPEKPKTSPAPWQVFERKWGKELGEIFGYQRPEALKKLAELEQQAKINMYAELIENLRGSRLKHQQQSLTFDSQQHTP